jgi:drug/metabolite transporter (DMT)-like permease
MSVVARDSGIECTAGTAADVARPAAARSAPGTARLVLAFMTVYIVWGSTYLAIRVAIETLPPLTMAGIRFVIAGSLLYAIRRPQRAAPLTRRNWLTAGTVGVLMLLGGNGLVCWAEQSVASGLAALLVGAVPIWMVVLDWLIYGGPRPTRTIVAGLVLGLSGIYLLIGPEHLGGQPVSLSGTAALLVACAAWSLGSLYSRHGDLPASTWTATALEMLIGGAALLLVGALLGEPVRIDLHAVSWRSLAALIYLIIFGSILALTAYKWLLQVSPPTRVATYAYVNPVIAILLGTVLAHEPLSPRVLAAVAVILSAVIVITRYAAASPAASPPAPVHGASE